MKYIDTEKIKAVMFDMDGTLFDTEKANYLSYKEALGKEGLTLDEKQFGEKCFGRDYRDFLPELYNINDMLCEKIHDEKVRLYENYLSEIEPNLSLFCIARALSGKAALGLVTTASRKNTELILNCFGITDLFDIVITQEDVTRPKPDPECYIKAMKLLDVSYDETLIFEDSATGLRAAENSAAYVCKVEGFGGK